MIEVGVYQSGVLYIYQGEGMASEAHDIISVDSVDQAKKLVAELNKWIDTQEQK